MKYIAPSLLVGYAIYSAFIPAINIAHSIILFSLAGLFAWNQLLLSRETPKLETELAKLKSELAQQIEEQKELNEKQFSELGGEIQKIALSQIKNVSSSSSAPKPEPRKYVF